MATWPPETIKRIAVTDDLYIAPFRDDGQTYGTLTWIWSVVVDGRLFVRAYNGTNGRWCQSAMAQRAGQISAVGSTYEVEFAPADPALNDRIDTAYQQKYSGSPYLSSMIAAGPQAATDEVSPQAAAAYEAMDKRAKPSRSY